MKGPPATNGPAGETGEPEPLRPSEDRRLNVLIVYAQPVFWSMGEGCGAAIFSELPAAIAARGHDVRVSLPGESKRGESEGAEMYRGFRLHRFAAGRSFMPTSYPILPARLYHRVSCWTSYQRRGLAAARELCASFAPDLVIGMGCYEAPVAHRLGRERGVANVTRLFGNSLSLTLRDPLRFYANFPEIAALRTPADLIVFNDDGADSEAVARRLRIPPRRIRHLRNGVDFDLFSPAPAGGSIRRRLGLAGGQPVLLTATRLAPEKKLERAIHALRDLSARRPDAVLLVLGDGPEKENLIRCAREDGVADRVLLPGPVAQRELPEYYREADLVLSLLDRTNAANPVFEAMACGRVVVTLDVGTARQLIRHQETGLLVRSVELPRLGEMLASWLDRKEEMRRMGEAASRAIRRLVMPKPQRMALEVDLFEEVVRRRRGGQP